MFINIDSDIFLIKSIVEEHKPHILGLGEANVRQDHALEDLHI